MIGQTGVTGRVLMIEKPFYLAAMTWVSLVSNHDDLCILLLRTLCVLQERSS